MHAHGASDGKLAVCMLVYSACTADPRVLKEAGSLAGEGHRVEVVAVFERGLARQERRGEVRIVRVDRHPRILRALRALRSRRRTPARTEPVAAAAVAGGDEARGAGYRALRSLYRTGLLLSFHRRAARLAVAGDVDVVHAHDLNTLPAARAIARRTGCRLVFDAHELYPEISTLSAVERRIWRGVERRLLPGTDAVLTVCESIAQELERRGRIPRPSVVLNCPPRAAVPAQRDGGSRPDPLRERAGPLEPDEPIVLYQGGFAPHRGLEALVDSAQHLERGVIVLMGSGRLEGELAARIEARGLGGRVRIVAPADPGEVLAFAQGADVGVIPYLPVGLNNRYTTPNKLFEYLAAGLPVAASRLPELQRFVEGLGIVTTFDPGDPRAMARTFDALLADDAGRAVMRARALQVRERYLWEAQAETLLELYARVARAPAAGSTVRG